MSCRWSRNILRLLGKRHRPLGLVEERRLEILMESIWIELRRVSALVSRILLLLIESLGPSVVLKGCGRRLSHEVAAKLLLF